MGLIICRGCERHFIRGESRCPFCGAQPVTGRAARAGTAAALALGLGVSMAACDDGGPVALYGPAPMMDGGDDGDAATDAATDADTTSDAGPVALYGPAPIDGGATDAAPADDGGDPGVLDGSAVALYGPAPVDGGSA